MKFISIYKIEFIIIIIIKSYVYHYNNLFFSASFLTKTVPCGNELHKFLIWDTAGQERVSGFLFCFIFVEIGG